MKAYRIRPGAGIDALEKFEREAKAPGRNDLRVRIRAVSLNFRDVNTAKGGHGPTDHFVVPCSDGAGEVIEVGADVKRFKVGDRVAGTFFPKWIDGEPAAAKSAVALAGNVDGVLAEEVVFDEQAVFAIPKSYDYKQASTLVCAGLTAWHALFEEVSLKPGSTVLLLGTGGVSVWALQLARAAGLNVIITSSSDEKLERARALGANHTINYKTTPEWDKEAIRLADGLGAHLVVEVGGAGTLKRSIAAGRWNSTIVMLGGVSGAYGGEIEPYALIRGAKHVVGIQVGSRAMAESLTRFVEQAQVGPTVDKVFKFGEAIEAYKYLESGRSFGKVVISLDG
jgi:NADPH:quinone reductase-like Zn-dependent oxidoreductase